jgi:hypothetical protein
MNAGDVAHQLARGDRPSLVGIPADISVHGRVEVEAPPIVQKGGRNRRQRFREGAQTEACERRYRRPVHVGIAEAFGPHDRTVHGYSHRQARQILFDEKRAREAPRLLDGTRMWPGVHVSCR